jgi:hypothetical protein
MARHDDHADSALLELQRGAKTLQRSMAKGKHPLVHVDLHVTAARLTIIIIGETLEDAYKHAKEFEDANKGNECVCTSSGETEVTCVCPGA